MRFLLLCGLLLATVAAQAQLPFQETFALRAQGGLLLTQYNATVQSTSDILDCGILEGGSGTGITAMLVGEFPIGETLTMGLGIGFADRSGTLKRTNTYPLRDTTSGNDVVLSTTMQVAPTLQYLEIQPDIRYPILGTQKERVLGLIVGPRVALPLGNSFLQTETVVSPLNAVFTENGNRTQVRELASGPFTSRSSVHLGLSAGLESMITITRRLALVPSVSYDYFFTNVLSDASWTFAGLRAELGVRFAFGRSAIPTPPPPEPTPVVAPAPPPQIAYTSPRVEITATSFSGEVVTGNQLKATEPIVNAVFFDSASAKLPLNYNVSPTIIPTNGNALAAHANLLPRIASILENNPNGKVVLEGATSGVQTEPQGQALALQRANVVRQALINLGVSPNRISTKGSVHPRVISNPEFSGGRAENRRVDIIVENAPLQEWVHAQQFAELRGTAAISAVRSGGNPEDIPTTTITIEVNGKSQIIQSRVGQARVSLQETIPDNQQKVALRITATSGGASHVRDTILLTENLPHRQISLLTQGFEAILRFEYNSADLSPDVQGLLKQLTALLPAGSTITIVGSADILGSEERNKVLSQARAKNTEQFIKSLVGTKLLVTTSAEPNKLPDDTPEGRFLNRSIRITATTP